MPGKGNRYGGLHLHWRAAVLARDPLCVMCKAMGRVTASTVADHIVPIESGGAQYDTDNGQGLCVTCHMAAKQSFERTGALRGCDETGTPLDPAHRWRAA